MQAGVQQWGSTDMLQFYNPSRFTGGRGSARDVLPLLADGQSISSTDVSPSRLATAYLSPRYLRALFSSAIFAYGQ